MRYAPRVGCVKNYRLYIFSDALGSTSDAVAEIDERTAHLLSLTLVETALATVSVNTIHLVIEP